MRLKMGQILFYRVLEKVLVAEKRKGKSIGALLDQTPFHQVLKFCPHRIRSFVLRMQADPDPESKNGKDPDAAPKNRSDLDSVVEMNKIRFQHLEYIGSGFDLSKL
jgi:hypothetical protein